LAFGGEILSRAIAAVGLSVALSLGAPSASYADDAAPAAAAATDAKEAEPATTKDPQIALDDLELLLAPMTKEETETEAKGWYSLLRAKEREITVAELNVRRKNREISQLEKQKMAAADLAKATEEVKAAASDKDKEAAAQHLAEAQKNLAQTVKTASKEAAKEEKKAEATTAAMAKQTDAAPPPAATVDSGTSASGVKVVPAPASDKDVLQKAAESAAKKSEGAGGAAKMEKVVAATEKEAAAADQIKTLAESAPAAGAAAAAAPGAATAAVADTSKKAEKLAEKADEATAAKTDVKVQLVDYSTQLMGERTGLTDRLKLVLDKLEAKGGDGKPYRLYIASIGGIKIDVSDRTATLARISGWLTSAGDAKPPESTPEAA
jgi:small conductance mechanosensitive channel